MDPSWFPPENRVAKRGVPLWIVAKAIAVGTLLLPGGRLRNVIAIPALLVIIYNSRRYAGRDEGEDYLAFVNIFVTSITWIDFALLRTPEKSLARLRVDGSMEMPAEIGNMTLWQKLKWNLSLFTTFRGIGWNWRVKNVDEVPSDVSRWHFVTTHLFRIVYCNLFIDFREWVLKRMSVVGLGVEISQHPMNSLWRRIIHAWLHMFQSGFAMSLTYSLPAIVAVGLSLSEPQAWPPMFGNASKAYTMRNVWGYCWHQYFRRIFETYSSIFVSLLHIRKGTLLSRYVRLFAAFFISAVIHHVGALNLPYVPTVKNQFLFFMLQPVAITVEDAVIALGKEVGITPSWKTKALGFVWVFTVLSLTGQYCIEYFFESGIASVKTPTLFRVFDRLFG